MKLKEYLESLNLAVGMTHRSNCPACKRHNTFTVSNDNGTLVYNCYANSCNVSGAARIGLSVDDIKQYFLNRGFADAKEPAPFVMPEHVVHNATYTEPYAKTYGLDFSFLDLMYDVLEQRVVFPIQQGGTVVDAIGRTLIDEQPKWRRYGEARTAYVIGDFSTAIIVEDAVSAAVAQTLGFTGFALLGTTLLREHMDMLGKYDQVVVALDPDACKKTIEIKRELESNNIKAFAFYLHDDLKYRDEKDITNLMRLKDT
jgi:DNA primase